MTVGPTIRIYDMKQQGWNRGNIDNRYSRPFLNNDLFKEGREFLRSISIR